MATCTNCGADVGSTDKFCGVCGTQAAAVDDAAATAAVEVPEEVPAEPNAPSDHIRGVESEGEPTREDPSLDDLIDERVGLWETLDGATGRAKSLADRISKEELGSGGTTEVDLSDHPDPFEQLDELRVAAETQIRLLHDVNRSIGGHESAIAEIKRKQMQKVIAAVTAAVIAAIILIAIIANVVGG